MDRIYEFLELENLRTEVMRISEVGIHKVSQEDYNADCCMMPSLSKSVIHTLLTRSPLHAWYSHPRLNPRYQPEHNSRFDIGSFAHATILQDSDAKLCVIDAEDWRTKAAREQREEARTNGLIPVLKKHSVGISNMRRTALIAIDKCNDLEKVRFDSGKSEQTIVWQESETWCRAKLDWLSPGDDLILDFKSTSASANPDQWVRTMCGIGGDIQAAFYLRGLEAIGGSQAAQFVFIVQEIEEPYAVSFVGMPPAFIEMGNQKVDRALEIWAECLKTNKWPSYPTRITWPDVPAYAQWQSAEILEASDWRDKVDEIMETGA